MTFKRLGQKITFISAAALIIAACEKKEEPAVTSDAPPAVEETQPAAPAPKTAEQIRIETFGLPDQQGITKFAGDRVYFAYDSSEIGAEARATLSKQAKWLMEYTNVRITIEGHCDERGTREYNLALGERRATAVKNYLTALGIPAYRLKTISYGKERPAVVGNGESAWGQNRRGVLVVQ